MFLRIFIAEFSSKNAHEIMGNNLYVFSTSYKTVNGFAMISEHRIFIFFCVNLYFKIEGHPNKIMQLSGVCHCPA